MRPEFTDAHFNLARAMERIGKRTDAKKHWRVFPALEPNGEWADFVKERLRNGR